MLTTTGAPNTLFRAQVPPAAATTTGGAVPWWQKKPAAPGASVTGGPAAPSSPISPIGASVNRMPVSAPSTMQPASPLPMAPANPTPSAPAAAQAPAAPVAPKAGSSLLAPPAAAPAAPMNATPFAGTTAIQGNEQAFAVAPTVSSAVTGGLNSLMTEAQRQMAQPTVYDSALGKQIGDAQKASVNEDYNAAKNTMDASLAGRGLDYSSTYGGALNDIETARARSMSDVDTGIARERANALASGRTAAFNNLESATGMQSSTDANQRNELRTERSYLDNLRGTARDQAIQQANTSTSLMQQAQARRDALINGGVNYGASSTGTNSLGNLTQEQLAAQAAERAKAAQQMQEVGGAVQLGNSAVNAATSPLGGQILGGLVNGAKSLFGFGG